MPGIVDADLRNVAGTWLRRPEQIAGIFNDTAASLFAAERICGVFSEAGQKIRRILFRM
ncbi:MAG: hypothetical protein WAU86_22680 [Oricola sp.]